MTGVRVWFALPAALLSPILFITFSRHSRDIEESQFGGLRNMSLFFFAEYVILLASSNHLLYLSLEYFAAMCVNRLG